MKKYFILAITLMMSINMSQAAIKEQKFEYKDGDTTLEGFLAYPEGVTKAPGIIVVHDWMGLRDQAINRARQLAEFGYVALAADVYGKGVRPANADEAGKFASSYKNDPKKFRGRMIAALDALKSLKQVDTDKLVALGFCFGGTAALELARTGANLKGVITFHGGLATKEPLKKKGVLKAKVLILHGADDPNVPPAEVAAFEDEMRTAGADWELVAYGNAVHAFTNPASGNDNSKGAAYNEKADKRSLIAMKNFLNEILQ